MTEPGAAERLLALRDAALRRRADLRRDLDRVIEATRDVSTDDEHDPEGSTIAFERSQLQAVLDQAGRDVAALEAAAVRVAEGRYGVCEVCGAPIPPGRLEARPTATTCVGCAASARR